MKIKISHIKINKGFTMVEFIVVATIFAIMSTISVFNFNDHKRSLEQTNVAQDIALSIRQAQLYGISAGEGTVGDFAGATDIEDYFDGIDIGDDPSSRGISVNKGAKTITLFTDVNKNGTYNTGDSVIDVRTVVSGDITLEVCAGTGSGNCQSISDGILDMTFTRPFPDADIDNGKAYGKITVKVTGRDDKIVEINSFGSIVVK